MATTIEYALMAGASYYDTRTEINRFPVPDGWLEKAHVPNNPDYPLFTGVAGFEAVSFQNIANPNDIVISFAGTYDKDYFGDWLANAGLAAGTGSAQLIQAAEYYLQVKATGANITLTGHSLGGGLAALIGVFFGVEAHTFDQAPFAQTALFKASELLNELAAKLDANGNRLYNDTALSGLSNFIQLQQTNGGVPNSGLVTNINVQGEFLSSAPFNGLNRIGATIEDINNNATGVVGGDLHSQALLTAFLQSRQSAASGSNPQQTLNNVTVKLPNLLQMIFNKKLFENPTDKSDPNFLERLVQHESGIQGSVPADAMTTRFTKDLWKLAQDGGLTMSDGDPDRLYLNNVSKTLTAFAMQMVYEDTANATNAGKEFFTAVNGGVRFDIFDVSKTFQTEFDATGKIDLDKAKGYKEYFDGYGFGYIQSLSAEERSAILTTLPHLRDWYVQAGTGGMNATDALNRNAFMLGGIAANDCRHGLERVAA